MGNVVRIGSILSDQANTMTLSSGMRTSKTAAEYEYTCERCGRRNPPIVVEVLGNVKYFRRTCQCEIEEQKRLEEQLAEAERRMRIERLFSAAQLGPRFAECTFANWKDRPGSKAAYKAVRTYVGKWPEYRATGTGLIIYGPPGNGKSHLAAAIVNELLKQEIPCIFRTVQSVLMQIRRTWEKDHAAEREVLKALIDADLLVLDDAGAEKWSDWSESMLYYIIDERYRWKRPVIITSNHNLDELEERVGFRAFDRLAETCLMVENTATSYRKELARQRVKGGI